MNTKTNAKDGITFGGKVILVASKVDNEKEETDTVIIRATIHVEKGSQKGIIIGKKGRLLKEIGTLARMDIENLLGAKVFLELWVKVEKGWSKDIKALRKLGYR